VAFNKETTIKNKIMAGDNNYVPLQYRVKRIYTLEEAVELMKVMDKHLPTGQQIQWVDAHTKKPVAIGYNK
jgi:hypothetical protein